MAVWLTEQDVRAASSPLELIGAMEAALTDFSAGRVLQPVRTALEIGDRSFFAVMPALYRAGGVLGAKLVTVVPANAGRGLHTHQAAIALFDPETGELAAMLDGRYITEARTAAASAVSAKHLARPESSRLAILGLGGAGGEPLRGAAVGAAACRRPGVEPDARASGTVRAKHGRGRGRRGRRKRPFAARTWWWWRPRR